MKTTKIRISSITISIRADSRTGNGNNPFIRRVTDINFSSARRVLLCDRLQFQTRVQLQVQPDQNTDDPHTVNASKLTDVGACFPFQRPYLLAQLSQFYSFAEQFKMNVKRKQPFHPTSYRFRIAELQGCRIAFAILQVTICNCKCFTK